MRFTKVMQILLSIIWILFCLTCIICNCAKYKFCDWLIILLITFMPIMVYVIVKKQIAINHNKAQLMQKSKTDVKPNYTSKNAATKIDTKAKSTVKSHLKCNCDGCPKQEKCKYGHVIYEEFEGRLSLFDKYMRLNSFEKFEDVYNLQTKVATIEELHNKKLLLKLDKQCLLDTKDFLEAQKQWLLSQGKCGRSYFYFMNMHKEIQLVDEAIKDYDFYNQIPNN